jgi:hypothetical protein
LCLIAGKVEPWHSGRVSELIVPQRFCGPPTSGNGGWTAGALVGLTAPGRCHTEPWPTMSVSLRQPPPLDTPMPVTSEDGVTTASLGGAPVAAAEQSTTELREVDPVLPEEARAAESAFSLPVAHPFPTCFPCGTDREEGDGLRIFPGPTGALWAATWTPHPSVSEDFHTYDDELSRASLPVTWGALDCIGGWAGGFPETTMVLARMDARLDTLPVIGEEHVLTGELRSRDGRKVHTAATLYDSDGRVVGTAEHLWITI